MNHAQGTTLILGGTGKTRRRVAERLAARAAGVRRMVLLSGRGSEFVRDAAAGGAWNS